MQYYKVSINAENYLIINGLTTVEIIITNPQFKYSYGNWLNDRHVSGRVS